jgi:RNA polymerase sigma-54 factor
VDDDAVQNVLFQIQSMDPVGIAARDVRESLLIQLRHLPERDILAEQIVEKWFELFEHGRFEAIVKLAKTSQDEVLRAGKVITGLNPYPGRHYDQHTVAYVIPDIIVEKRDDEYVIFVNDDSLPQLQLSKAYRALLRKQSKVSAEIRQYLEDKYRKAEWLIRSIDQRRKTLYRVMETILEVQRDFFDKGLDYLRPLTLKEVADRVGLHESTISRVANNKYVQTPRGVFGLKYFFSSSIRTADGGEVSSKSVKALIRELIQNEDAGHPLSDQKIVALLTQRGFDVARRTVAKYREELNLLPASKRKRWNMVEQ